MRIQVSKERCSGDILGAHKDPVKWGIVFSIPADNQPTKRQDNINSQVKLGTVCWSTKDL